MESLLESVKFALGAVPVADAFAGTKTTAPVNMKGNNRCTFLLVKGAGAVGTATVTVEKCSDTAGTGAEAIPFFYKRLNANNTEGTTQEALAAGFNTSAAANEAYIIEVNTARAGLAKGDKPYVRLKTVEVVDDPITGMVLVLLSGGRYISAQMGSVIV